MKIIILTMDISLVKIKLIFMSCLHNDITSYIVSNAHQCKVMQKIEFFISNCINILGLK